MKHYQAVVIGGGHAGIEAVNILNLLKIETLLITLDKNKIGLPSCNPSIGGVAKSHLVYELDAVGGLMPLLTDACGINYKLLNSSKGPAVWSLRVQIDSIDYPSFALRAIEDMQYVDIVEDEALELIEKLGASDDYFERQKAAWALVNLGEAAVDQAAKALEKGEFSDLRYKSAWVLGKIGCPRGI